jgi:K(+)-stimulated pyrophosphate-energized sodium pump
MSTKKDTIFLFLSGTVFFQLMAELMVLFHTKGNASILKWMNYFNFLSLVLMGIFFLFYVKKNYSDRTSHKNMEKFYNIIKKSSINYYFQQLFHNMIPTVVIGIILILINNNLKTGIVFFIGFGVSSLLGYLGIEIANQMNIRMANMALAHNKREAENVSIYGGLIMGIALLLPLAMVIIIPMIFQHKLFFCFGSALSALLTKLTGGFFTKSADIAADMVGKLDYGLPEDDFRNPAVLADNMGDIVGDAIGAIQGTFAVACLLLRLLPIDFFQFNNLTFLISLFIMVMVISSGLFFVTCNKRSIAQRTLLFLSGNILLLFISVFFYKKIFFIFKFKSFLMGMITIIVNGFTVYFFTSPINFSWGSWDFPIKDLAKSSQLGAGINVLKGMSLGKICTFVLIMEFVTFNIINYWFVDFSWFAADYALGVLSLTPFIMALDNLGPIADNGGGLVESVTDEEISVPARKITDEIDQFGNTTKAITKVLNYILLAALFFPCLEIKNIELNSFGIISAFVGCGIIMGFLGFCINIVLNITDNITQLIKNIFDENPKILSGEKEPDYEKVIKQLTQKVLNSAHWPFYIVTILIILFILINFGMFKQSSTANISTWTANQMELIESFSPARIKLLELSIGLMGIIFGMYLSISGGAWDNCKKLIESGSLGYGKKTAAHNNAIIGDLVGDIRKDVTGPALAPLVLTLYFIIEILFEFIQKSLFLI